MPNSRRRFAPLIVIFGMIFAMMAFAGPATAAPYVRTPSISVSTQTPRMGAKIRLCGRGFRSHQTVKITLDRRIFLAYLPTNSAGAFCATVKLPKRIAGGHRIWAVAYKKSASAWIRILQPGVRVAGASLGTDGTASGGTSTSGGTTTSGGTSTRGQLAFTGATVIGIGALGGLLLTGGGLLLLSGKRRKARA
ncbi:MAG TPA: hypothetical protein VES02_13920 [Dermatophilaceae bacterium]|nr:hypothetical protein [Dermatophilaceae bacterium]